MELHRAKRGRNYDPMNFTANMTRKGGILKIGRGLSGPRAVLIWFGLIRTPVLDCAYCLGTPLSITGLVLLWGPPFMQSPPGRLWFTLPSTVLLVTHLFPNWPPTKVTRMHSLSATTLSLACWRLAAESAPSQLVLSCCWRWCWCCSRPVALEDDIIAFTAVWSALTFSAWPIKAFPTNPLLHT